MAFLHDFILKEVFKYLRIFRYSHCVMELWMIVLLAAWLSKTRQSIFHLFLVWSHSLRHYSVIQAKIPKQRLFWYDFDEFRRSKNNRRCLKHSYLKNFRNAWKLLLIIRLWKKRVEIELHPCSRGLFRKKIMEAKSWNKQYFLWANSTNFWATS